MPTSIPQLTRQPSLDRLIQDCLAHDGCRQTDTGAVVAYSGRYTGRTPKDKVVVRDAQTEDVVWWENNGAITPERFAALRERLYAYAATQPMYEVDAFAGADPRYRIAVRFLVQRPYHALFVRDLLIRPTEDERASYAPDWTILDVGPLSLDPEAESLPGDAVIALDFTRQEVLIAGTEYAGEMKKAVFTIMNYLLPRQGVLSMHCSANVGSRGDVALFFGLSGTGKTTLSADPERELIGDDEHGWSVEGVFNVEGGCYAKCIGLSREREPMIWDAVREGAILENVPLSETGHPDYDSRAYTENTRVAYPIEFIPNARVPSVAGHPEQIFFLTSDAWGILPPLARLSPEEARFYFLNGYTSKLAGTEVGVTEPQLTFSACFGQPFLPLPPRVYADMLMERIRKHGSKVWLVNTGWTGGPYGTGRRIALAHTRALLHAAFSGEAEAQGFTREGAFNLEVPNAVPNVPPDILHPRQTWPDPTLYDQKAAELRARFEANFQRYA